MPTLALLELLAALPPGEVYVNPWKVLTAVILFTLWVLLAQWVDKDAIVVNTYRIVWNVATMLCGVTGLLLMFLLPDFLFGALGFTLVNGILALVYVLHRNSLVVEEDKVCTPAHFKRLMTEGFSSKKKEEKREVSEKVRITGADGKVVGIPEEDEAREQFGLSQDMLYDALWNRASLVEVIPAGQHSKIRLEIDGVPVERDPLPRAQGDLIVAFFKRVAGLNLEERRKPQKGQIMGSFGADVRYDIIVKTDGSSAGEKLTLRIIGEEKNFKVDNLGFTEEQLKQVRDAMYSEHGVILLSAPPKNGLTTTVYSFARSHDAFLQNIQMIEYDPELELFNITRHVFKPEADKAFADELQRVIRTDPDVIVLPEVREKAVGPIAATAASRKQIIYVALPSLDLLDALRRWAGMVGDAKLLARSLRLVTHQRLIRKLCDSCKTPYKPDPATLQRINMPPDTVLYKPPEPQYDKRGNPILCQACHGTGYLGRTAVFAVLPIDEEMQKAIASGSLTEIKAAATRKGGLSLQQPALQKVLQGLTSIEEVVRVTRPPRTGGDKPARKKTAASGSDKPSAA